MIAESEPIIIDNARETQTFELLAGDAEPMPFWCRVRLHRWSRWGRVVVEKNIHPLGFSKDRRYQTQICLGCGARNERVID